MTQTTERFNFTPPHRLNNWTYLLLYSVPVAALSAAFALAPFSDFRGRSGFHSFFLMLFSAFLAPAHYTDVEDYFMPQQHDVKINHAWKADGGR